MNKARERFNRIGARSDTATASGISAWRLYMY
jgi:hypothetical protein